MSSSRGLRTLRTTNLATTIPYSLLKAATRVTTISHRAFQPHNSHVSAHRFYSSHINGHGIVAGGQDVEPIEEESFDLPLEDEMLTIQNAAIAEIESQLGKSLEEAVLRDNLAQRLLGENLRDRHEDVEDPVDIQNHGLVLLRFQGASSEEMAREARSIFGDRLPKNALRDEELVFYKRLYGTPSFINDAEEIIDQYERQAPDELAENVLLDADGAEVLYSLEDEHEIRTKMASKQESHSQVQGEDAMGMSMIEVFGRDARAIEIARALDSEVVDEFDEMEEDDEEDSEDTRSHPLTSVGRFATQPRTKFFDAEKFIRPIERVMGEFSNKHLKEMCEKTFGGPGLPDSPLTPRSARSRPQVPIPLGANQAVMGQMEANAFIASVMPPTYASLSAVLVETRKRLGSSWLTKLLARPGGPRVLDAGSGGVGILAWQEIVQAHWDSLHTSDKHPPSPPRTKSVVLTGSETLRSRSAQMLENTTFVPRLPDYVNARQGPTIDDDRPAQSRKQFDVIISSHALFSLREEWERKQYVQNLWSLLSDDGGVLILVEKGIPRGFEAVAAARDMLLQRYIAVPEGQTTDYGKTSDVDALETDLSQKIPGMIIAPCTTHGKCPLYKTSGLSKGRRDVCSFQQRYVRPAFLQRIIGAKDRNHDDVDFSYVAVMKGDDLRTRSFTTWDHVRDPSSAPRVSEADAATSAENQAITASEIQQGFEYYDPSVPDPAPPPPTHALPRILSAPLKRRGHVTLDVCTPQGDLRRWTIPRSFSRQAYRDARKARWGDLWALGAKTSIPRNLKLGLPAKELIKGEGMRDTGIKPKSRKAKMNAQIKRVRQEDEEEEDDDDEEMTEADREEEAFVKMLERDNLLDESEGGNDSLYAMETLAKSDSQATAKPKSKPKSASKNSERQNTQSIDRQPYQLAMDSTVTQDSKSASRRIGYEDGLSAWAEEFESTAFEDEARRRLGKTGRRPTASNTQRLKRDLRRAEKKQREPKNNF